MNLETKNDKFDINKSEEYINKIQELDGGVNLLLDEFKSLYVLSIMHPNDDEIQQRFQNITTNINKLQSTLFSISNNIQVDINELNKKLFDLDILIRRERKKNKELKKKLGIVEHKNNSAFEMINDYKEIYNVKYLRNWALFLSTIICIFTISSMYKKQGV